MAFTKQKFISLSSLNQKKKLAFAVREYLDGNEAESYICDLIKWYNELTNIGIDIPQSRRDYQMLHERLAQEIETSGQNVDVRLFDGSPSRNGAGIIVLDNIRAPYNVGGIMRSAEAFGAAKVIMCGITPTADNAKVRRAAMNVPILTKSAPDTAELLILMKTQGYYIIAVEKTKTSVSIDMICGLPPVDKRVLVVGNEEFGVSDEVLNLADMTVHIPLIGSKNSLNVCTAAGIAMYSLFKMSCSS